MDKIRLGTRGSPLALAQARLVREALASAHKLASSNVEIVPITTTGDTVRDRPLAAIGGKGLFTKEIEEALLSGAIDIAVHSMKDMPGDETPGLVFPAVLPREDARDAFISVAHGAFSLLPQNAVLGSSSVRRTAQARRLRPDLRTTGLRGNVETRLRKLKEGLADATFLACAGLKRLGLSDQITEVMGIDVMLPAVAQGIIVIQTAAANREACKFAEACNDHATMIAARCERAFLTALQGSCQTPIAGHAIITDQTIRFRGQIFAPDGSEVYEHVLEGGLADAAALGREAATRVMDMGGAKLLTP